MRAISVADRMSEASNRAPEGLSLRIDHVAAVVERFEVAAAGMDRGGLPGGLRRDRLDPPGLLRVDRADQPGAALGRGVRRLAGPGHLVCPGGSPLRAASGRAGSGRPGCHGHRAAPARPGDERAAGGRPRRPASGAARRALADQLPGGSGRAAPWRAELSLRVRVAPRAPGAQLARQPGPADRAPPGMRRPGGDRPGLAARSRGHAPLGRGRLCGAAGRYPDTGRAGGGPDTGRDEQRRCTRGSRPST